MYHRPHHRPQLIEQTAKGPKALQAVGALAAIAGGVVAVLALVRLEGPAASTTAYAGGLALLAGIVLFTLGRLIAWWRHG